MPLDLDNLLSELALLRHLVRHMAAVVEHWDGKIERLKFIIKRLQRAQVPSGSIRISLR
ncbi:MAG: IS66 family transposase, partial [Mesorhizobium sp.]